MATVTSLTFSIFARYSGGTAMARAQRDLDQLDRRAARMNRTLGGSSSAMGGLARAALLLTPALIPIGTAALGVAGGLAAATVTAGLATGVFAGLAITSAKNAATMGRAGVQYQTSLRGVKGAWMELARATAADTLRPMITVLDGATAAIGRLKPVVKATSPVFQELANKMKQWMSGQGMKGMVDLTIKYGIPSLRNMTRATWDLFITFTLMIKAFAPFGVVVTDQLRKGAAALRQWAQNGGFERFMQSVQKNGPVVRQFFQALGPAMMNVLRAASPLGPVILRLATVFLRLIAAMPTPMLTALIVLWQIYSMRLLLATIVTKGFLIISLAVRAAIALWMIAQWGLNAAMWANPIGVFILACIALVAVIAAIVFGILMLIKHWRGVWTAMKVVAQVCWIAIKAVCAAMVWFFTVGIPFAAVVLGHWVVGTWITIRNWLTIAFHQMTIWVFKPIVWFFTVGIPIAAVHVRNWVVGSWITIRNALAAVFRFLVTWVFSPIIWFFAKGIPTAVVFMAKWIVIAWTRTRDGVTASFRFLANNVFKPMGTWFTKTLPKWANTMWHALVFAFTKAVQGMAFVWNKLRGILKSPISFFVNTVYNKGIVGAWNNTIGKIPGVPNLPKMKGFAAGGYVSGMGGPTADKVPAWLSPGEFVIKAATAKKVGYGKLSDLNNNPRNNYLAKGGMAPGFALGGIIPNPIDIIKKVAKAVTKIPIIGNVVKAGFNWAADFTRSVAGPIVKKIISPFRGMLKTVQKKFGSNPLNRYGGGGANIIFGAGNAALDALTQFALAHAQDDTGGGGFAAGLNWAKGQAGKKYQWGGNGNPSWDCSGFMSAIESVIRGEKPHRRWATGAFSGHKAPPNWGLGKKSPFQIGITNRGVGHTAGTLNGVNVECSGGAGCHYGSGARGANDKMFQAVYGLDPKVATSGGNFSAIVSKVLSELHLPQSNLQNVLKAIQKESGGRAHAVNRTDSNAKAGHASQGLLQVIPSTFAAFAGPYKSRGITDPLANIYAAINYASHRYGAGWSARMAAPGGYARGGLVNSFDKGGFLPEGLSLAYNGTGAPEPVGHGLGGDVIINGNVYTKSEREFREMVIEAFAEAKRRKRV